MEQAQSSLKRASVVDKQTGKVDLRYNPLSVDEDYFIPVRGSDSGTDIQTLGGGTMAGETNDVEYIQKKLFSALKIPKAYLGYDEGLGAKATLSQEDIRFSRTIARIQRTILSEMNKIAIIHLYCQGYTDEDLLDFKLKLSNPSTIAQQQKLELFRTRFEVAAAALQTPGLVNRGWVQKNIMRLTDEEIKGIRKGLVRDKVGDLELESTQINPVEGPEIPRGGEPMPPPMPGLDIGTQPTGAPPEGLSEKSLMSIEDIDAPIRALNIINKNSSILSEEAKDEDLTEFEKWQEEESRDYKIKRSKAKHKKDAGVEDIASYKGNEGKHDVSGMPRLMTDLEQLVNPTKTSKKSSVLKEEDFDIGEYLDSKVVQNAHLSGRIQSTLKRFDSEFGKPSKKKSVISENNSSEKEE